MDDARTAAMACAAAPPGTLAWDEVLVWRVRLDRPQPELGRLFNTLSEDERERAARFRFQEHRDYYVAGRGA
ncbi:MAG: hypothetical protein JXR94_24410, partial [Candidatus Hydrogenedentes bacterium]|nr:hypothetical protein [Candidatus Hydrogenedentota bacterium]